MIFIFHDLIQLLTLRIELLSTNKLIVLPMNALFCYTAP
jgi:hypothetical protein